jgi:hypothetical protein
VEAVRIVAAVLGGLIVLATAVSVISALVIPGARAGLLHRGVDRVVLSVTRPLAYSRPDLVARNRIETAEAPLIIVGLLALWLALFLVGYALIIWPESGPFSEALRQAGSSLATLGIFSTRRAQPVDLIAGITGLTVVALQIAYLPTLYSSFSRRETELTLIALRAGRPAWGPELLARVQLSRAIEELDTFYEPREQWIVEIAESHTSYPILLRFRSTDPHSSWIVSLLAVMDSAALLHSLVPSRTPVEARLCLQTGFGTLRQLGDLLGIAYDPDPRPDAPIQLTRAEFEYGLERIRSVGLPFERDADDAWRQFRGWRVNYEALAYAIALVVDAVPALWAGSRHGGIAQVAPIRQINRTPENLEGRAPREPDREAERAEVPPPAAAPGRFVPRAGLSRRRRQQMDQSEQEEVGG